MPSRLEARLTRLEESSDYSSKKFVVVGHEAEREALARAGRIPDGAIVVMTGVSRSTKSA
jgi:hypothetical protein